MISIRKLLFFFIYLKDSINVKERKDVLMNDLEFVCLEVELWKSRSFIVIAWYRPPNRSVDLFPKLESVLSLFENESKDVIILGDTNCDLTKKAVLDNNAGQMRNIYELFSLRHLIEEPPQVTMNTSKIIDHIAATHPQNILKSGVHIISASDHYMCCKQTSKSFG